MSNRPKIDGSKSHENLPEKILSARAGDECVNETKAIVCLCWFPLLSLFHDSLAACIHSVSPQFPNGFLVPTKGDAINLLSIKNSFIQNSRAHSQRASGNANHNTLAHGTLFEWIFLWFAFVWLTQRATRELLVRMCSLFLYFLDSTKCSNISREQNARRETQSIHGRQNIFVLKIMVDDFKTEKNCLRDQFSCNYYYRTFVSTERIDRHRTPHNANQ